MNITATPSSKDATANDPKEVIGFKARELTFNLAKYKSILSMERISFILIDQVRSNIQIESPWARAGQEKSVGTFGNYKAATAVASLQHHLRQWFFLSRGVVLKNSEPLGVDGWILHLFTEKNKLAPSQYSIPLIFDKKWGVIPILSEYHFLGEKTRTENKYWPKTKKLIYPFCINTSGNSKVLSVMDPTTGSMLYTSDKFMERNFLNVYRENQQFRYWFDKAVDISIDQRIKIALFRNQPAIIQTSGSFEGDQSQEMTNEQYPQEIIDEPYPQEVTEENIMIDNQSSNQDDDYQQYDQVNQSNIQTIETPTEPITSDNSTEQPSTQEEYIKEVENQPISEVTEEDMNNFANEKISEEV